MILAGTLEPGQNVEAVIWFELAKGRRRLSRTARFTPSTAYLRYKTDFLR
jgi:hypothetical protein